MGQPAAKGPVPLLAKLSAVESTQLKRLRGEDAGKAPTAADAAAGMAVDDTVQVAAGGVTQPLSPDSGGEDERAKKDRHAAMGEAVTDVVTKVETRRTEQDTLPKPTSITHTSPSFPGDGVARYLAMERVHQEQLGSGATTNLCLGAEAMCSTMAILPSDWIEGLAFKHVQGARLC